jgi:hypothetical protein
MRLLNRKKIHMLKKCSKNLIKPAMRRLRNLIRNTPPPMLPNPPKSITPPPVAAQPAKKTPDVAVSSDKTDASVGNIYASGGSSQNSNTSINPYR